MARIVPADGEKPLRWVGSSKRDFLDFPGEVQEEIGSAISAAQFGGKAAHAKPWRGQGSGVFEITDDFRTDTYRVAYSVRFAHAIYVLHAFQKKSRIGIKTDRLDVEMIERRLRMALDDYEAEFGGDNVR